MAEVVGVVASGIAVGTLGIKVIQSTAELKGFWDNIQEAPEDIADLLYEAKLIGEVILRFEEETKCSSSVTFGPELEKLAADCLQHCYAASEKLRLLAEDLAATLSKKTGYRRLVASTKVVLKKDQIKKYRSRLEGAVRLLHMSRQCYVEAQQRHICSVFSHVLMNGSKPPHLTLDGPSIQQTSSDTSISPGARRLIQTSNIVSTAPPTAFNWFRYLCGKAVYSEYYVSSNDAKNKSKDKEYRKYARLQYRWPGWLANQVWITSSYTQPNIWDFNMRIYNVIPRDSVIFDFIKQGNIEAIKTLFKRKAASPFDKSDEDGWTLLHHAVFHGNLAIMQLLIENGASTDEPDFNMESPFRKLIWFSSSLTFFRNTLSPVTDMFRLLINAGECDFFEPDKLPIWGLLFYGPTSSLALFLDASMQSNREIPLLERHRLALLLATYDRHNAPTLIRTALGHHPFESLELELEDKHGQTLVSNIMFSLRGFVQRIGRNSNVLELGTKRLDPIYSAAGNITPMDFLILYWVPLIRDLANAGADLHHIVDGRSTFLDVCELKYEINWRLHQESLRRWLQLLADAGIDLTKFGKAEATLLQQYDQEGNHKRLYRCYWQRLIGFSYGARPSDWEFWFEEHSDKFAGQFWYMIDHPELKMPGAWVEDGDDDDNSSDDDWY
ncbi:hypothetical protein B0O99DRAFT_688721 [Bisporella sp. PMI_857]|nr:hypothetical protein B0O99DRAFT_688721 [Bisporella sp. PMI_857]